MVVERALSIFGPPSRTTYTSVLSMGGANAGIYRWSVFAGIFGLECDVCQSDNDGMRHVRIVETRVTYPHNQCRLSVTHMIHKLLRL